MFFPASLLELWNNWELRAAVLLSLLLQIILIALGSRRKYISKHWIRIITWLAYLSADWVATFSLGLLSNKQLRSKDGSPNPSNVIMAFWAPFLLVHLGGPDTITAYSLEDNELWIRHLLNLVVQVGVAFYVFVRALKPTGLNFVAIPIFVAGIVKYGERTWILRSASSKQFRKYLLPHPDPGPNYAKFMEEYKLKESEGFILSWSVTKAPRVVAPNYAAGTTSFIPNANILNAAHSFFLTYKRLFADLILSFQDLERSLSFFQDSSWKVAYSVIEMELGFVYDVLYTKAAIVHSAKGFFLRFISFFSTLVALMIFWNINWHGYPRTDVSITFLLLFGAIGLEIYAILLLLLSDWTLLWLSKHENKFTYLVYRVVSHLKCIASKKKWANSMGQLCLLESCLQDVPNYSLQNSPYKEMVSKSLKVICSYCQQSKPEDVSSDLKESIFKHLLEKSKGATDRDFKQLCAGRGDLVLKKNDCLDKLGWSISEVEFDHSILLWHIATELCFYSEFKNLNYDVLSVHIKVGKLLANYMLYLLVERPYMLPNGIGQIRYQDTRAEAREFFKERNCSIDGQSLACTSLLRVEIGIPPAEVKGDRSKSILFDACNLAKMLQSMESEKKWDKEKRWEVISQVWIEMLSYAACQCRWNHHAQQLGHGGELLTHVWLLMTHLGITQQFQISQGHARTKLVVQ